VCGVLCLASYSGIRAVRLIHVGCILFYCQNKPHLMMHSPLMFEIFPFLANLRNAACKNIFSFLVGVCLGVELQGCIVNSVLSVLRNSQTVSQGTMPHYNFNSGGRVSRFSTSLSTLYILYRLPLLLIYMSIFVQLLHFLITVTLW
jgi:hypothetical protein